MHSQLVQLILHSLLALVVVGVAVAVAVAVAVVVAVAAVEESARLPTVALLGVVEAQELPEKIALLENFPVAFQSLGHTVLVAYHSHRKARLCGVAVSLVLCLQQVQLVIKERDKQSCSYLLFVPVT